MKIFDKLKSYFSKEEPDNNAENEKIVYDLIRGEVDKLTDEYLEEIRNVKNDHYIIRETEEKIMKLIDENPFVVRYQDASGTNIGMYSTIPELKNVVLRCLDDEVASTQQDHWGYNIGMHCASKKYYQPYYKYSSYADMEECILKALDNKKASTQINRYGQNIGILSASNEFEEATLKALDNQTASIQQDSHGLNIGMHSADKRLERATLKSLDNEIARKQLNFYGADIGTIAANRGLKDATIKALMDREQSKKILNYGQTLEECAIKNHIVSSIEEIEELRSEYNENQGNNESEMLE